MKKNLQFKKAGIALFAIAFTAFTAGAQVPTPDLLHYKFNGVGTSVTNYASAPPVGTATGTIMGAQTQSSMAIACMGALVGSGGSSTTDYINTGWNTNLGTAWTISFWSSNIQPSATLYYIFGDVTTSFRCFTNGVAAAGNWILRGTGMTDVLMTGAATTASNMVTFVYDQTAGNIVGYINGAPTVTVSQAAFSLAGGAFKIGGYSANTGLSPAGLMADYRIYTTALTPAQVLSIYNSTAGSCTTGIKEKLNGINGLSLSPNPNTGKFVIELKNGLTKNVQLFDVTGRVIFENTTDEDNMSVDISNFSAGLYYAVIGSGNETSTVKVIKD